MSTLSTLFIQGPGGGQVVYSAATLRGLVTELWDPGVMDLTAFKVSGHSGAPMSVDVSAGTVVVAGTDIGGQGNYLVRLLTDATELPISSAPGSGTRHDLVAVRVKDETAGGPSDQHQAELVVIEGTASSTPADPSLPPSVEVVSRVRVPSGTSSITDSLIDDLRVKAGRRDVPGALMDTASPLPISGWLPRDGREVSRSEFAALFAEIAETYGPGDGSTTFNLPDSRGRKLSNVNDMGTAAGPASGNGRIVAELGETGGTATHTLTTAQMPAHTHAGPAHTHAGPSHTHGSGTLSIGSAGAHTHGSGTLSTGSAGSHTHDVHPVGAPATTGFRYFWGRGAYTSLGSGSHHRIATDPGGLLQVTVGTSPTDLLPATAGSHSHSVSGSTASAGSHSHSVSGSTAAAGTGNTGVSGTGDTSQTGSGNAHPNTDPYLAVYGWIRT